MKNLWILIMVIIMSSCGNNKKQENHTTDTIDNAKKIPVEPDGGMGDGAVSIMDHHIKNIEKAHKKADFLKHKVVSFNIAISFGGKLRLDGKITMLTNSAKIRIDKKDESTLVYTGEKVFLCPEDANDKGARFDIFTWTYFFGMPYKLNDSGSKLELENMRALNEVEYQTAKLTFEKGTGDSPDDWYIIYTDPKNHTIQATAYIVTFGSKGDITKAEGDPHIIQFQDFKTVEGIPFATKWKFYGWTEEKGITNELGEAIITDITFLEDEGSIFETPDNAKEIKL
ncbi:hypothetical protein ATE84_1996 [Aquimarina sp. MAR_2010_214]|uniref:DUF6503 family protein n=1 Tax=Aquimarina sp. MAR_2010_214 TaxID=1250026 RepID=UPI000CB17275|nr:DUF6503 family protein [Aquimarina sp. MAR_2010_214]PKV49950.1 hypothetical protein ATE84_1996 [Aquimarina sp. MAR_2010_214]